MEFGVGGNGVLLSAILLLMAGTTLDDLDVL